MVVPIPSRLKSIQSRLKSRGIDLSLLSSLVEGDEVGISRGEEDRISLLPESLLCHILSFRTTHEAVSTSVLSSRWRNLWKWVPRLELESSGFPNHESCVDFIDKFLNLQSLREFKLCINSRDFKKDASFYEPCLGKLNMRKIQRLKVHCYWDIEIPITLPVCEALVCLSLFFVRLNDFESPSLPRLKNIYLEDVIFPNDTSSWVLDTPRLEYLTLIDKQFKSFKIISMSDSVKVDINVNFELTNHDLSERNIIYDLLNKFSAVGDMTISWRTLKLIYRLRHMNPLPKFYYLIRLRVTMSLNTSLEVLPIVLERCPNLKRLSLELVNDDEPEAVVTSLSNVLSFCLVSSLEYVEIESPMSTEEATEEKLVRYFLDNATSLKKLSKSTFVTV